MSAVVLRCRACGEPFEMERRRGVYPVACPACRGLPDPLETVRRRVLRLVRFARAAGVDAKIAHDRLRGWAAQARTPWHEWPVVLEDREDVRWLLLELGRGS